MTDEPQGKWTYNHEGHVYTVGGKRAPGASTTAKIVPSSFLLEKWVWRQILIGAASDPNILENVAVDPDNIDLVNEQVEMAKKAAGAHRKADRGTQAHRALQMVLLSMEDQLLTSQQHADAKALRLTLARYGLKPTQWVEHFVFYPQQRLCGRFDAIVRDRDDELVTIDLKTGLNAVRYPQTTGIQLAYYNHAPWMAKDVVDLGNGNFQVTSWEPLPEKLRRDKAYVLQIEPDEAIGHLYAIDTEHGWKGAQIALEALDWRKALSYGDDMVSLVEPVRDKRGWREMIEAASTRTECRLLWSTIKASEALTPALRGMLTQRAQALPEES